MSSLQPPVFEDEASLFSLATEYLEAGEILARTPSVKLNVSLVTFYLLGHAAELLLKSLLHMHGVPIEDLKSMKMYGHNLSKLIEEARKRGLLASTSVLSIEALAKTYTSKHTEYRQKVAMSLPPINPLLQELLLLKSQVFNHVGRLDYGA
jgi:hypothetical protein